MAVESRVTQEEIKKEPEKPVDREKVCWTKYFSAINCEVHGVSRQPVLM